MRNETRDKLTTLIRTINPFHKQTNQPAKSLKTESVYNFTNLEECAAYKQIISDNSFEYSYYSALWELEANMLIQKKLSLKTVEGKEKPNCTMCNKRLKNYPK